LKKCKYISVEVWWVDSISQNKYWYDVNEGIEATKNIDMRQRSVGILIRKNKERIVIAQSMGLAGDGIISNLGGFLTIPREAVFEIKILK